jgi:hypothetical protein
MLARDAGFLSRSEPFSARLRQRTTRGGWRLYRRGAALLPKNLLERLCVDVEARLEPEQTERVGCAPDPLRGFRS